MASLRNQGNQKVSQPGQNGPLKPLPLATKKPIPLLAARPNAVPKPSIKPSNRGVPANPPAPLVKLEEKPKPVQQQHSIASVSIKLPTLSGLRDNIPQAKRQRILQDVVRTAGKENGLLQYHERPSDVRDIYADDIDNESVVVAYVEHIYTYLHERETQRVSSKYMEGMSINPRMRAILVDWITSVMYKFKMCQDTLYLSVDIVDRFLAIPHLDVTKDELQLIGVAAMFIASKFEEVYPPDLEDFEFISDKACSKAQIIETEMVIANALNFDFTRPAATHFLRRCCKAASASTNEYALSKYIAELSLLNIDFVGLRPSLVAAAAVYLTMVFRRGISGAVWDSNMEYYSRYTEADIKPIAGNLLKLVIDAPKSRQQCIYKKYLSKSNDEVAEVSGDIAVSTARYMCVEM